MQTLEAAPTLASSSAPDHKPQGANQRLTLLLRQYRHTLSHYTAEEIAAIRLLYETVKKMPDTGGGIRCARLLLGLYNGTRFPFDLTDLRSLDSGLYAAAMKVLDMDARRTWCEVHVLLEAIYGDGRYVGAELEQWAYNLRLPKRCKKEHLSLSPGPRWASVHVVAALEGAAG